MEPEKSNQINGQAPIVGWSNITPSLTSTPGGKTPSLNRTPNIDQKPTESPNERPPSGNNRPLSLASSGIGGDSLPRSTTPESLPYSPASSLSNEPPTTKLDTCGTDTEKMNGDITVTIQEEPTYEVKFLVDDKDSIISSNESLAVFDDDDEDKPKIPDGGWGWVVVSSSLVISMIADGISFSFGLLYIQFLYEFGESKSKTAWIGSLFMAVPLLSGPIMSTLVDKYGCRKMTILGGLISGLGFILSSYVNSIELMYVTFGVIAGIGLGLCYVTAVVSIAYWFDKKRTLAVGLGACGTGIGTFVYAPMTQYFIDEYGWRGTTLLLAGTFLNMCVCGAVMRDPEWWILEQNKQQSLAGKSLKGASSCGSVSGKSMGAESNFPGVDEIRKLMKSGETPEYILTTLATSMAVQEPKDKEANTETLANFRSVVNLPTFIRQSEKVPFEVLEKVSSNKRLYNVILENYPSLLLCRSYSDKGLDKMDIAPVRVPVSISMRLKQSKKHHEPITPQTTIEELQPTDLDTAPGSPLLETPHKEIKIVKSPPKTPSSPHHSKSHQPHYPTPLIRTSSLPWLKRQLSTNAHYLKDIKLHRNSVMYRGAMLNIKKYRLRASSCPNIYRNSMITIAREEEEKWYTDIVELIKSMMDFSMFLELHFLLVSLSTILLFTWFIVPYFYLAEHLTRNGYTETDASRLISLIGVCNAAGMIGLGWAGDQPWMNVGKTFGWCLMACGLSTAAMPFFTGNVYLLGASGIFFGLFFASSYSFTPAMLVQLMPLETFTTAYGLILLCQGIGNLVGPPLAGFLFDVTGTWEMSFYQAGFWIFISGLLILYIPYSENRILMGNRRLRKDSESS